MAPSRTVKTGTCTSRVAINYRAVFVAEERIQLTLDAGSEPGLCQLRIYSPDGKVVSERVVRSIPATIEFNAKAAGRYEMELSTVSTTTSRVRQNFTWSDWDRDFVGSDDKVRKLPDGVIAVAFLDVT
jgi:hypothetical protein